MALVQGDRERMLSIFERPNPASQGMFHGDAVPTDFNSGRSTNSLSAECMTAFPRGLLTAPILSHPLMIRLARRILAFRKMRTKIVACGSLCNGYGAFSLPNVTGA